MIEAQLALPAYEQVLKAAHSFNLLDARGAISVTERAAYIGRIRNLARAVAQSYYESRERLGFLMADPEIAGIVLGNEKIDSIQDVHRRAEVMAASLASILRTSTNTKARAVKL